MISLRAITCVILLIASQLLSQTAPEMKAYLKRAGVSETAGAIQIVANSPRPLAQILDSLREKYGWAVSYEDPQFTSKLDLVQTDDPTNRPARNQRPAGGPFSVEFPSNPPNEQSTLQLIVDSYNRSNNPGRFELRKTEPRHFAVVGVEAHDRRGQVSRQRVAFDLPITIPSQQRTAGDTVLMICRTIATKSGVPVTLGVSPRRVLDQAPVTVGGAPKPARELLLQTLAATQRSFYWQLLFDPNSGGYFLEIHLVQAPE